MRIEHYTSWDHIAAADVADLFGDQIFAARPRWSGTVSSMVAGWAGGQAINAPTNLRYDMAVGFEAGVVRVRFKATSLASERKIIRIASGATTEIDLLVTTAGRLRLDTPAAGNVDVTSTAHTPLVVDEWYSIEFGFYLHNTAGATRVRLDGVDLSDLHLDNVDITSAGSGAGIFGRVTLDNPSGHFDDFILKVGLGDEVDREMVSDTFGNPKIATLYPNGKGFYEQWINQTGVGDHYLELDETTGDAIGTYLERTNSGSYLGARESWQLQDLIPFGSISVPDPTSNPVAPTTHPGVFSSDEWEDFFTSKPSFSRGNYVYDDNATAESRVSLLSAGRLQFTLTSNGSSDPRRTEIGRWDPTKSAKIFLREPVGVTRFYSIAFEIPSSWVSRDAKAVVAQFYESDDDGNSPRPPLSIEIVRDEFRLVQVVNGVTKRLDTIRGVIGKQHRFTLQAIWSHNNVGELRLWYNDTERFYLRSIATINEPSPGVFFKFGIYLPGMPNGVYPSGFNRTLVYNYYFVGKSQTGGGNAPAPIAQPPSTPPTFETTIPRAGIIDVMTVFQVRHGTNTVRGSHFWRMGGADFDAPEDDPPGGSNVWTYQTKRWPVSPLSGKQWTAFELNNAEVGIKRSLTDIFGSLFISQGCVVVLYTDAVPEAETTPGDTLLVQKTHHLSSLWKIERRDGVNHYLTDHNAALLFDGDTYNPAGSFDPSARRKEAYLREANFDVRAALTAEELTAVDLETGKFRNAKVTEYLVDWRVPWHGFLQKFVYWVGDVKFDSLVTEISMTSTAHRLRHKVGEVFSRVCRYRLGDARCKVPLVQLTKFGIDVESVIEEHTIFRADTSLEGGSGSPPDDYYNYGVLTWVKGANLGLSFEVKDYTNATDEFLLQLPTPFPIAAGDRFNVEPGCNHLFEGDCLTKFANTLNYGGHPYIPGSDRAIQTPRRRQ